MPRVGGAGIWVLPITLIIALAIWASASPAHAILAQDETTPVEIGAGPIREPAWALVGRALYGPESTSVFGYFTALKGLDPALLFTTDSRSESTARFTYAGEITLTDRADRGDVTSMHGEGVIRIYLNETAGASWDDPASFAAGQVLAELDVSLRETLHRQGPGIGLVVGDSDLVQVAAEEFTFGGEIYRFGNTGIAQRLRTVGAITASDAPPGSIVSLSGAAAVSARPWTPVRLGAPATPVAGEGAQADLCPGLAPWLSQTRVALAAADDLAATFLERAATGGLDPEAARTAAEDAAALASAQRAATAPTGAEEAHRLAVTALSTYARGLQTVKDGVAAEDQELIAQGQLVVADGERLAARAREALDILAAACPNTG